MKTLKAFIATIVLTILSLTLAQSALAAGIDLKPIAAPSEVLPGECTGGVGSLFQEAANGTKRCPPTETEKFMGGLILMGAFIGALDVAGVIEVFPLNGGVASGVVSGL